MLASLSINVFACTSPKCGPMGYVSSFALMLECHPRRRRVRQRLHRLVCCQVSWTKSLLVCQPRCPPVRLVPNHLLRQPVSSLFQALCEASVLVNVWTSALVSRFFSVSANVLVSAFGNFKWHAQVTSPGRDIIAQFVGKCLGLWYLQVVR